MLTIRHISKTFDPGTTDAKKALNDLSFHAAPGDFVTIIGANGAGKSTLFGAIAGSFITDSGEILLDGEDITVAFNPSYLVDGLSAISEPFVRMKMTTAVKPVEFNGQQEADSDESMDYRYLLVPMRFNN